MTRHPFESEELGMRDAQLAAVASQLERYAAEAAGDPPGNLSARIRAAVDAEPRRRWPLAALFGLDGAPARAFAAAGLLAVAVLGAIVVSQLADLARDRIGASPSPSVIVTPSESPSPTPTPSPTSVPTPSMNETPTPTPSPTHIPSPSQTPQATPAPTPSAGDTETPHPAGSDNSGPGGGGGNSGPGGGSSGSGSGGG
jgi:hypothetical protein